MPRSIDVRMMRVARAGENPEGSHEDDDGGVRVYGEEGQNGDEQRRKPRSPEADTHDIEEWIRRFLRLTKSLLPPAKPVCKSFICMTSPIVTG